MERYLEFILKHYLLCLALVVVTFLLIQELLESAQRKFQFISPMMAVAKMNNTSTTVIDVRDAPEFVKGHIESAINIPLDKLDEQIIKLNLNKDQPIIVACQTGTRSTPACKTLTKNGYSQVLCLTGGMESWEDSKFPIKITSKNKG